MKSIWKTKKKDDIVSIGQNLFKIVFDLEEDRLIDPIDRKQV